MSRKQRLARAEQCLTRIGQTSLGLACLVAAELPAGHLVSSQEGPGLTSLLPTAVQTQLTGEEPFPRDLEAYQLLRCQWRNDPVRYAAERLGLQPTWQQQEILDALIPEGAKVSVRS